MVDRRGKPFRISVVGWTRAMRHASLNLTLASGLILQSVCGSLAASAPALNEYELKAAFLYNFVKFTEWPAEESGKSDEPFIIGVVGKDPFGAALDKLIEGETIYDKKIVARRFARMDAAMANSHV